MGAFINTHMGGGSPGSANESNHLLQYDMREVISDLSKSRNTYA